MTDIYHASSSQLIAELVYRLRDKVTFAEWRLRMADRIVTAFGGVR